MSIKVKEVKFSTLILPPPEHFIFGMDSEDSDKLKILTSNGDTYTIQTVIQGGVATGDSVTIGTRRAGTLGQYYLANGYDVLPTGDFAQSSGRHTTALGAYSHSSGEYTIAGGQSSFTGGVGRTVDYEVRASGVGAFNFSKAFSRYSDAAAVSSAILGGVDNRIMSTATNTIVLGGNGITATMANTTYVQSLVLANSGVTSPVIGTIAYNGTNFVGFKSTGWVKFDTPTDTQIANWNTAYGWGNHATYGYVKTANSSNGQMLYNSSGTVTGTSNLLFSPNEITYGNITLCSEHIHPTYDGVGLYCRDTITSPYKPLAVYEDQGDIYTYGGGYITISGPYAQNSNNIYISSQLLTAHNIVDNLIMYNTTYGTLYRGKPTTLAGYGITDAMSNNNPTFTGTLTGGIVMSQTSIITYTNLHNDVTMVEYSGRRAGNVNYFTFNIKSDSVLNRHVFDIIPWIETSGKVFFTCIPNVSLDESGRGYVTTTGEVYMDFGKGNPYQYYWGQIVWITP